MMRKHLLGKAWWLLVGSLVVGCAENSPSDEHETATTDGKADSVHSSAPDRVFDIPFYFGVPKTAVTLPLPKVVRDTYPYPTLWNASNESDDVGLRVIAVPQRKFDDRGRPLSAAAILQSRKLARQEMAKRLAPGGVIQDGDIVLTFRPELGGTMAYPHIQMGSTHSSLAYTKSDGQAYNVDSPLDSIYVGQFNTEHFVGNGGDDPGADALHILRPRVMQSAARKAQMRQWLTVLRANIGRFNGQREQLKFQNDYMKPVFVTHNMTTRQTVTTMGRILLELDKATDLDMYCSEFIWHMIALSSCTIDDIRRAPAEGAACVNEPFAPMPLTGPADGQVGVADGPLLAALALPADMRQAAIASIFVEGNASRMSEGHREVSRLVAPLMDPLSQLFGARAMGATVTDLAGPITQMNAAMPPNYSPTSFLVAAMPTGERTVDYVATVAFIDPSDMPKARELAKRPVPASP